jgi:hypothetical protein
MASANRWRWSEGADSSATKCAAMALHPFHKEAGLADASPAPEHPEAATAARADRDGSARIDDLASPSQHYAAVQLCSGE